MKYFRVSQDRDVSNLIAPAGIDPAVYRDGVSRQEFDQAKSMIVTYFANSQDLEKPDILYTPAFLVSDRFKRLLQKFDSKMRFKGIRCYPENVDDPEALLYWWPYLPKIKCLSEKTEKYPTGLIRHLVVESAEIPDKPIIMMDGTLETIVLVSEELAESMLRRNFWGMDFLPVDGTWR